MNKLKKNSLFHKISLIIISLFLGVSLITFNYFSVGRSASVSGFDVPYLTAETNDIDKWTATGNLIIGTAKGKDGTCGDTPDTTTLSIVYNNDFTGTIEFDYSIESRNGQILIGNKTIDDNSGHFSKNNISNQGKIEIKINSENGTETKILLTNIICKIAKNVTLTFKPSENGHYSLNGQIIENIYHFPTTGDKEFKLLATPDEGYSFNGWMLNGTIVSSENPRTTTYPNDAEIVAIFIDSRLPTFLNDGKHFYDLDEAINNAKNNKKNIYLIKSGTLINGSKEEKKYVISNGINLIIPYEANYVDNTTFKNPVFVKTIFNTPSEFRKLIIDSNITLEIQSGSSISVLSKLHAASGSQDTGGSPTGPYGIIHLTDLTSKIVVKDKGELYAYGYITGSGLIQAENGSNIVETYQIADFKGGSASSKVKNNTFLFNQYYIQNVECKIEYYYGTTENTKTALVALKSIHEAPFNFIYKTGDSTSTSGLFKLSSNDSKLTKKYDNTTDRIHYELENGSAEISSIKLKVAGISVDSSSYVLPITSNMEIVAKSGTQVNIHQDLCFLPGSKFIIEEGATVNISSGKKIYLYDRNNWIGKNYTYPANMNFKQVKFSPSRKNNIRSDNDLLNAIFDINGKVVVENNSGIYTTYSNTNYANVFSSNGTGQITYHGEKLANSSVYQFNASSGTNEKNDIKELMLRNSTNELMNIDDTYYDVSSESSIKDFTFYFDKIQNKWMKKNNTISSYKITFVDSNNSSLKVEKEYNSGEDFVFPSSDDTQFNNFTYNEYNVKKWIIEGEGIFDAGKSYQLSSSRDLIAYAIYGGWTSLNGDKYYIDYDSGNYYKGLKKVEDNGEIKICKFKDDTGIFDYGYTNTYLNPTDNKYYFINNGVVKERGFYKYSLDNTSTDYNYVFVNNDNTLLTNGTYYIDVSDINNSLLPSGYYTFDNNGLIFKEDKTTSNYNGDNVYIANIDNKGDSTYINGIRVGYGLFIDNNHYKYSNVEGYIVKDTTYYVSKTNNLNNIKEGLYYFDSNGYMYDENFNIIRG